MRSRGKKKPGHETGLEKAPPLEETEGGVDESPTSGAKETAACNLTKPRYSIRCPLQRESSATAVRHCGQLEADRSRLV
jgi:hypothetical protein